MFAALRASTSRAGVRAFSVSTRAAAKQPLKSSSETPQPVDLLTKIGRGAEKKLGEKAATWNDLTKLYKTGSSALEDAGLGPKERKYIMWAFSRYSTGDAPSSFIEPPRPAKKIRGWGPRVQNGKRVK